MKSFLLHFWQLVRQFKSSAVINVLGLSAALTVFFVVLMQIRYDFTFDKGYSRADEIVQFNVYYPDNGYAQTYINFQTPARVSERLPGAGTYCMAALWGSTPFDLETREGGIATVTTPYTRVTPGFLQVFEPEITAGDTAGIFAAPGKALISGKTAQQFFGTEDPIGKPIRFHWGGDLIVAAVCKDFPENSSIPNGIFGYLSSYDETEWSFMAYFRIRPEDLAAANEKVNTAEIVGEERIKFLEEHPEITSCFRLTPLTELYLHNAGAGGSKRINTVLSLMAIGVLTLIVAFVNFVNLSLAMVPSRVRGINLRKILGINKLTLKLTIAMESVGFTAVSLLIALAVVYLLKGSTLATEMFTANFSLWEHAALLAVSSVLLLLIAFLIGLYTSRYSTSFDESEALKGSFALGTQGVKLRNALIILQFTTAIGLIAISVFIKRQHDFMIRYDWGLPKENIVYVPLAGLGERSTSFGQELLKDSRITDYCISRSLPGEETMTWGRGFEGKSINLTVWSVDERFFDFFDVKILAGRKPETMDSVVAQLVVNEAFLRRYEFDESIVGKEFDAFGPGRIQAIAQDVNFQSLHQSIGPMAFGVLARWNNFNYVLIKLSGSDVRGAIRSIETTWKQFSQEPLEVKFLDETMNRLYQKESNMAKLIGVFGLVIALIAVMGVYGLIVFNTRYKKKEIAIRKVNGATIREILLMLNRNMLLLLGIAFVLAVPLSWYAMTVWLEGFAYRASIPWWLFLGAGVVVLLISVAAVSWQSYRAARTNPADSIKSE